MSQPSSGLPQDFPHPPSGTATAVYCPSCRRYSTRSTSSCVYCLSSELRPVRPEGLTPFQLYRCGEGPHVYLAPYAPDATCRVCHSDTLRYAAIPLEGSGEPLQVCRSCQSVQVMAGDVTSLCDQCYSFRTEPLTTALLFTGSSMQDAGDRPRLPGSSGSSCPPNTPLPHPAPLPVVADTASHSERSDATIRALSLLLRRLFWAHYGFGHVSDAVATRSIGVPSVTSWASSSADATVLRAIPEEISDINQIIRYLCALDRLPQEEGAIPSRHRSHQRGSRPRGHFVPLGGGVFENLSTTGGTQSDSGPTEGSSTAPPTVDPPPLSGEEGWGDLINGIARGFGLFGGSGDVTEQGFSSTTTTSTAAQTSPTHLSASWTFAPGSPTSPRGTSDPSVPSRSGEGIPAGTRRVVPGFVTLGAADTDRLLHTVMGNLWGGPPSINPSSPGAPGLSPIRDAISTMLEQMAATATDLSLNEPGMTHRLSDDRITRIPWVTIPEDTDAPGECPVCTDDFTPDQRVRQLEICQHRYHDECIKQWFQQGNTCPVCRHRLLENVADEDQRGPGSQRGTPVPTHEEGHDHPPSSSTHDDLGHEPLD